MRVAVVSPYAFDAHGGVQDQVARLVRWLRDDGHVAWAVAPGSDGPIGTRHVGGYRFVAANRSRAPISMNPRIGRKVAAAVADADVVHVHEPLMPFVSLGAVRQAVPPLVGTFHADPGRVARFAYRGGAPVLRRLMRRLGAVTAVSEIAAQAVRGFCDPIIVPNGIDLDAYQARGVERVPGRVVFVGRDDPRKGLDVLLEAWPAIRGLVPRASLHVVGTERDSGPDGVAFLGRLDEERKVLELCRAEVLVAPNLGGESFGLVVLEGLAAGCATVASDLPSFRAVVGEAAHLVAAGDAAALATAVSRVLSSPDELDRLMGMGRTRSREFGRDRVVAGYLEAYEAALAKA